MSLRIINDPSQMTLAVIAGGAGQRMGKPKSRLTINGRPILQYLLERMEWNGPTLLVTAPGVEGPPGANLFDREVTDRVGGLGPLCGLATALEHFETAMLACIAVDMVGVGKAMIAPLTDALALDTEALGVMYRTTNTKNSGRQPFPSAFRREARNEILPRIERGKLSIHRLVETPGFRLIAPPDEWPAASWTNLNVPEDLAEFETLLREGRSGVTFPG